MSISETCVEEKKRRVKKLSHEQDYKQSQRQIVEMLVGASSMINTHDDGNDDVVWNACPCQAVGYASKGCALKLKNDKGCSNACSKLVTYFGEKWRSLPRDEHMLSSTRRIEKKKQWARHS